ncbi:hypothetical protein DL770_010504 [Monosporascus sp. CRB-9-2]|nr:hypothetical protein DL770_010504 [Monosporascus sp. CRB-9-2]
MKLCVALTNIILSVPVLKAAASPAFSETTLQERQGFSWDKCTGTGPESCTVYMATSDGTTRNEYRIATLYDSSCNVLQVYETDPHNPKIVLKGNLPHYVDLYVDSFYRPNGRLSYSGQDYPLERMACYKFPDTDGLTGSPSCFPPLRQALKNLTSRDLYPIL